MGYLSERDEIELKVHSLLKTVIDPELNISIIDMGLVYNITYENNLIEITMTLSSKGCPMGEMITGNVREVITENFPEKENHVNLVWEPAWNPEFINAAGKAALGR